MKYDLVFEGGGAKGMVFVGACEEFFKRGHTFDRLLHLGRSHHRDPPRGGVS